MKTPNLIVSALFLIWVIIFLSFIMVCLLDKDGQIFWLNLQIYAIILGLAIATANELKENLFTNH